MRYRSLARSERPTVALVCMEEMRQHVRVDEDEEELAYLGSLVSVATDYIEDSRSEALLDQQWTMTLDHFPGVSAPIRLPRPPLRSVASITYVDTQGVTRTLAPSAYRVLNAALPGEIHPVYGTTWPSTLMDAASVTVTYRAGYGTTPGDVPSSLRQACKILAATWFEHREGVVTGTTVARVPGSVDALIALKRTEW